MQGYCARCGRSFDGQMLCPRCGIQLTDDGGTISTLPVPVSRAEEASDGPSFFRRIALGAITLLGMFHGLKHFILAISLGYGGSETLNDQGVLWILLAATVAGCVATGTVNRRAELAGFLLGLASGLGLVGVDLVQGHPLPEVWLAGIPSLLAVIGAIAGLAGRLMIPPAPTLPKFGQSDSHILDNVVLPGPRLVWWRIVIGAVVAILGAVFADPIREWVVRNSFGEGTSFSTNRLLTWQISILAALVGGLFAGANTPLGVRQGLFTGLMAGAGCVISVVAQPVDKSPVLEFWTVQLAQSRVDSLTYASIGITTALTAALGGWLGGHILPPATRD